MLDNGSVRTCGVGVRLRPERRGAWGSGSGPPTDHDCPDDYNQGQLDKAVRKVARNEAIVEAWLEKAKLPDETYRPTIGFGVGTGFE